MKKMVVIKLAETNFDAVAGSLNSKIESKIGDLNDLETSNKSSAVGAINSINSILPQKAGRETAPYCLHRLGSVTLPAGWLGIILVRCWSTVGSAAAIFSCLSGNECTKMAGGDVSVSQNGYTYTFTSPWGGCYLTAINVGNGNPG